QLGPADHGQLDRTVLEQLDGFLLGPEGLVRVDLDAVAAVGGFLEPFAHVGQGNVLGVVFSLIEGNAQYGGVTTGITIATAATSGKGQRSGRKCRDGQHLSHGSTPLFVGIDTSLDRPVVQQARSPMHRRPCAPRRSAPALRWGIEEPPGASKRCLRVRGFMLPPSGLTVEIWDRHYLCITARRPTADGRPADW